ncbi:MAG: NAD(P)-dependent alcohol dehydrogenase [Candidatus Thorarchaeota archaeon]
MKVVQVDKYGPPEGLKFIELDKPIPKDNEVLVRIHATTVTYGDATLRRMRFPSRLVLGFFLGGLGKGKVLGHEFAGEIETVGKDVTLFKIGDQVFGSTGMKGGAHAEYICLPEDSMMTIKPTNLSLEDAAAVPVGGNTALDILRKGNIQSGQKILVYGASGSVGTYAVQLAKYWGAEVTGVSSTANLEMVRSIGADKVIDYTKEDFTTNGETYHVIFDAVRKISSSKCKESLSEDGVFLSTTASTRESTENLVFLKELIEAGNIRPVIDRTYPLEEIVEAHRYVDTGRKKGNIVITVHSV